jgi:dipeptidyl aminopeptidase/acylaminoacyl peptidase
VARQNRRRDLFEKVGSPSAQSSFWRQVAPVYYLDDLKGAVGLFHAINDDVVNIGYSRDLVTELEKASVSHEFHEYTSGGHNIDGASFVSAMQDTVEFYDRYLK